MIAQQNIANTNLKYIGNFNEIDYKLDLKSINKNSKIKGVYDITNEEYHSMAGISRSGIMEFNKTPFHYWNRYIAKNLNDDSHDSESKKIGRATHYYMLEPEKFSDQYLIVEKKDKRTKEGKLYYEEIKKVANNRELLDSEDFSHIKSMGDSLRGNEKIKNLIIGAQYEKSLFWNDPDTGFLCKVRPDIWQNNFICDLKTCVNADYRSFQLSLYKYGYHLQCAMMSEAFKHIFNIDMREFIFIAVENTPPFAHAIYLFDEFSLEKSVGIFKKKLIELKHCFEKNEWPSYQSQFISLPNYIIGE